VRVTLLTLFLQYSVGHGTSTHSAESDSDVSKFKEFYQHLSYLVVRDISDREILKEIRTAIQELGQQKVSLSNIIWATCKISVMEYKAINLKIKR